MQSLLIFVLDTVVKPRYDIE
ncbi:palindromic element RPE4 domain-containing protein [Candidatus Rickettsia barbariae]